MDGEGNPGEELRIVAFSEASVKEESSVKKQCEEEDQKKNKK